MDAVVEREGKILLIRRGREPFRGRYALPGGFVEYGERLEDAVLRELREETGLVGRVVDLLCVRSDPERDPRGHVVSVVFVVHPESERVTAGDDASHAGWVAPDESVLGQMAFDHGEILREYIRWRSEHSIRMK